MTEQSHPQLKHALPDLVIELETGLRLEGEHLLAGSVQYLRIYGLCECTVETCGSFYTGPKPQGAFGPGHRNVLLDPSIGMTILDVVDEVIRYVELIDRPEIHAALRSESLD